MKNKRKNAKRVGRSLQRMVRRRTNWRELLKMPLLSEREKAEIAWQVERSRAARADGRDTSGKVQPTGYCHAEALSVRSPLEVLA